MSSFDNVFFKDENWPGVFSGYYCQKFFASDTAVTIQIKVYTGLTCEAYIAEKDSQVWEAYATPSLINSYADYDIYEFDIDFSSVSYSKMQFKVVLSDGETWISEPVCIIAEDNIVGKTMLQLEYWNTDNAFEVDYSTSITQLKRIECHMLEYEASGETEVYDNERELTNIRGELERNLMFATRPIPRYLAEQVVCAMKHDNFFINEVEFILSDNPEIQNKGNLTIVSAKLRQRNVIGLNTHDIGFDCDAIPDGMACCIIRSEDDAFGASTFAITKGYAPAFLRIELTAGSSGTFKAGFSAGASDIVPPVTLTTAAPAQSIFHFDIQDVDNAYTFYFDVSGSGAKMDIYLTAMKIKQHTT